MKVGLKPLVATAVFFAPALVAARSTRGNEYELLSAREFAERVLRREINSLVDELALRTVKYHAARGLNNGYQRADELDTRGLIGMLYNELDTRDDSIEGRGEKTDRVLRKLDHAKSTMQAAQETVQNKLQAAQNTVQNTIQMAHENVHNTLQTTKDKFHELTNPASAQENMRNTIQTAKDTLEKLKTQLSSHSGSRPSIQGHAVEENPQDSASSNTFEPSKQPEPETPGALPPIPPGMANKNYPPPNYLEKAPPFSPAFSTQYQKPNQYDEETPKPGTMEQIHKPDERD